MMLPKYKIWFLLVLSIFFVTTTLAQKKSAAKAKASIYTQVYSQYTKACKDVDTNTVSEGEDVPQLCKGYGGYGLYRTSAVYRVSLAIQDSSRKFTVPVVAAEDEKAKELENTCVKKFGEKIEWLVEKGKPFAFIVRVSYFKDTNNDQTVFNAKNKVGEFLFVRGLKGFESLQHEVSVMNTAFNPNEQARMLAYRFYAQNQK
jgi:hypothetical protein